ncbi:hypothetical protein BB561_000382 [Smittium simulii]|uniref:Presequence translocated-associated motor subunit PAM17 n=1 Tax=Smittium simulii TaxID=133385 RepID=A0A2T9YZC4_9FUNG|nr:hypothetical protein BB561_000382 [Smittium simulii]
MLAVCGKLARSRGVISASYAPFVLKNTPIFLCFAKTAYSTKPQGNASGSANTSRKLNEILNVNSSEYFDWATFFKLRTQKRAAEIVVSVPATFISMTSSAAYLSTLSVASLSVINGVDPTFILAGCVAVSGGLGYLFGRYLGGLFYNLFNRNILNKLTIKETDYFNHIKNNRSDPKLSSFRNPLPDFYGEKISSTKDYREWLKKQRLHELKGRASLLDINNK